MEKKVDRRVRKTKQALKEGLTKLMLEKSINDISVKELTELVDINRGTFYLHYKDIFDMLEQIEHEMLEEFYNIIENYDFSDIICVPELLYEKIYTFIQSNSKMWEVLLSDYGDIYFINKFKDIVRKKSLMAWKDLHKFKNDIEFEYLINFIQSGCIGLFEIWLKNGMQETPKEMAKLTTKIILHDFEHLGNMN